MRVGPPGLNMQIRFAAILFCAALGCDAGQNASPDQDAGTVPPGDSVDLRATAGDLAEQSGDLAAPQSGDLAASQSGDLAAPRSGDLAMSQSGDLAGSPAADLAPPPGDLASAPLDGSLAPYPGLTPVELTTDTVVRFGVAHDEAHVAFSRSVATGSFGCQGRIGQGDLSVATVATPPTVAAIEPSAGLNESGLSGDGKWIFYTQYDKLDPCTLGASAYKAATDGSGKTFLSSGGALYFSDITIQGNGALWRSFGSSSTDPGWLRVLNFSKSSPSVTVYGGGAGLHELDPTGRSVVYDDPNDSNKVKLAPTDTGTAVELSPAKLSIVYRAYWAPDGNTVALLSPSATSGSYTLSLLARDGSNLRTLSSTAGGNRIVFTPDSTRVVYDATVGGTAVLVSHPVAGGADAQLSYTGTSPPTLSFQNDSRWVHATADLGFLSTALYLGDVTQNGALVTVTGTLDTSETSTLDGSRVAYLELINYKPSLKVFTPGGATATLLDDKAFHPVYEPVAVSPRLAAIANFAGYPTEQGDMQLYSADGTFQTALPGRALGLPPDGSQAPMPFWAGRTLFYAVNARSETSGEKVFDLVAARDDGSVAGVAATRVTAVHTAPLTAPTRIFYSRSGASGGGLWTFAAP
jgi:hypothetical protein